MKSISANFFQSDVYCIYVYCIYILSYFNFITNTYNLNIVQKGKDNIDFSSNNVYKFLTLKNSIKKYFWFSVKQLHTSTDLQYVNMFFKNLK